MSLLEAKDQPVWGSQFHPEKLAWEWSPKEPNIPRSRKAIKAAGYFADFFVSQVTTTVVLQTVSGLQSQPNFLSICFDLMGSAQTDIRAEAIFLGKERKKEKKMDWGLGTNFDPLLWMRGRLAGNSVLLFFFLCRQERVITPSLTERERRCI